ncbi:MAG TPA: hypothetical protein VGB85_25740, partial [Nannocystis sp.]
MRTNPRTLTVPFALLIAACNGGGAAVDTEGSSTGSGSGGESATDSTPTGGATDGPDTAGPGDCPSDAEFFETHVWQPILSKTCVACHIETGLAKDTRMVFLPAAAEGAAEHNLVEAREVAVLDVDGTSLLLLKPTNKHPDMHKGGAVVQEGSAEYEALAQFVERSLGTFTCEDPMGEDAA